MKSDTKNLTKLGSQKTDYQFDQPRPELLETFENQHQDSSYIIPIEYIRFTSLCPKTKQPDGADIYINYIPNKKCVESKSLKLYMFSYRNSGSFMEDITNTILKDLIKLLDPQYIEVYAKFISRGDIYLRPFANHYKKGVNKTIVNELLDRYYSQK